MSKGASSRNQDAYSSQAPTEEDWDARLTRIKTALGYWRERVKSPENVMSGSSLAADDQIHPEMPCSQLAWWGLSMGVEHLDGTLSLLEHQIEREKPILPAATYTVLRGALLGASQAALLLCTPRRTDRINYALRIAHEEYRQEFIFTNATINHGAVSDAERQSALGEDFLGRAERGKERVKALLAALDGPPGTLVDTEMSELAAKVVHRGEDADLLRFGVEMEWRLGSGSSHGRLLMNTHRPQAFTRNDEGNTAYFSASKPMVIQQMATVFLTLQEAWRIWELRRFP
ncbi:MAG: hypothetical protein L0K46_09605 [Yaniella sp.]|nr:hypothetical protein [Yaniella sp.]